MTDFIAAYRDYLTEEKHASANTLSSYIRDLTQFHSWLLSVGVTDMRKVKKETINEYLLHSEDLQFVCQLIDIRHEPMASDVEMFRWLVEHNLPVLIVATKADKISRAQQDRNIAGIKRALGIPEIDVLPYSSLKNEGRSELLDVIGNVLLQ